MLQAPSNHNKSTKNKKPTFNVEISLKKDLPEKTIGQRIKKKRIEKGWTIKQLAKKANLNEMTVGNYERDVIENPTISVFKKLSKTLGVSIKYLSNYDQLPEKTLGQKLKKYRLLKGLTHKEFAKKADLNPSTILNIENGITKNPYETTTKKIKSIINVKLSLR